MLLPHPRLGQRRAEPAELREVGDAVQGGEAERIQVTAADRLQPRWCQRHVVTQVGEELRLGGSPRADQVADLEVERFAHPAVAEDAAEQVLLVGGGAEHLCGSVCRW
jgi:hypothetical protein